MKYCKSILLTISIVISGCATSRINEALLPQLNVGKTPSIMVDAETGIHSFELSVLTYNVAALPWPLLENRSGALEEIGNVLAEMRITGDTPDIVLIQEGFRRSSKYLIKNSAYPNWVRGPSSKDRADEAESIVPKEFIQSRQFFAGEKFGKIVGGGLYILSEYPIQSKSIEPFFKGACAGFDCASNKGLLFANIKIPGMPGNLQIMTTHLNSKGASGVSDERSLIAFELQLWQMVLFLDKVVSSNHPFIYGGDFNIKNAEGRLASIEETDRQIAEVDEKAGQNLKELTPSIYCASNPECDYVIPLNDEKLDLEEKQDWQGVITPPHISVEPILVDHLFHDANNKGFEIRGRKTLSDHDGLLVVYKVSWHPDNI